MASISLYRKYRSQTFAEVVGQAHITTTLAQAVAEQRLHHAYLFTGPRGTGKTSTARILAKALNCERGPTPEPCNVCAACTAITAGSHVDVIEIDAASHGGVDDVRDLRDRVAFSPVQARTKVYIVDECHMLSTAGWNAFLKTLEEPPGHVIFVFATTEPHKVLDTILSRTQRFDFKRIDARALTGLVADLAAKEGVTLEDGTVDIIVRSGDGSARDTLSVLDQVIAFTGKNVTVAGVEEVLGAIPGEMLHAVAAGIASGDVAGLCTLVDEVVDAGHDLRQFSKDAVEHLRSLFLLQVAPDAGLVTATPERLERLRGQSSTLGRSDLLRAMDLLTDAQALMRRGTTRLALEIALAKAAMPEASGDPAALAARLDRLEHAGPVRTAAEPTPRAEPAPASVPEPAPEPAPASVPEPAPEPAPASVREPRPEPAAPVVQEPVVEGRARTPEPPPADQPPVADTPPVTDQPPVANEPPVADEPTPAPEPAAEPSRHARPVASGSDGLDVTQVQASWDAVLEAVKQRSMRIGAFLQMSDPVAVDDGVLVLQFRAGYGLHAEQCASSTGQETIGAALERVLGTRPPFRCVVAGPGSAPPPTRPAVDAGRGTPDDEAASVADTEAADDGVTDETGEARHDEAIARLEATLGATVVDDQQP